VSETEAGRQAAARARLQRLAWLLDSAIPLPGGYRVGLDGLIGLVPGLGDVVGALLSSYIVVEAARLRVPGSVLLRMLFNLALELVVGALPVVGDLFDVAFKANERNVRLIEASLGPPQAAHAAQRGSRWLVASVLLVPALLLLLALALLAGLVRLLLAALGA
jgi:Domain of unknown function (DUF4112)